MRNMDPVYVDTIQCLVLWHSCNTSLNNFYSVQFTLSLFILEFNFIQYCFIPLLIRYRYKMYHQVQSSHIDQYLILYINNLLFLEISVFYKQNIFIFNHNNVMHLFIYWWLFIPHLYYKYLCMISFLLSLLIN